MAKPSVFSDPGQCARIASDDLTTPMPAPPPSEPSATSLDAAQAPHGPGVPSYDSDDWSGRPEYPEEP
jgi:hypothetical protein